jgi:hypothetical protein
MKWICSLLLCAAPAFAQPAPPAAAANEDPAEVAARVRYERALRADFDGHPDDAVREAQACLEARPDGRFAEAARTMIGRLRVQAPANIPSTGVGPRTELVIGATTTGLYLGSLLAGAAGADNKGTTALLMIGTGSALTASLLASAHRRVPQSMPQMLENGVLYGTEAAILGYAIGNPQGSTNIAGGVAAGVLAGVVLGLGLSPYLTGGDSGAITTGIIFGGGLPSLIVGAVQGKSSNGAPAEWAALLGSTAGLFAGPVLNRQLHYSRGRWNLITLGGGVGALVGSGLGVLTDAWNGSARGGLLLTAAGAIGGLALMSWLTNDFGVDEPRPGSAALVHVEGKKLSLGDVSSAISPIRVQEKTGGYLRLAEGRF